MVVPRLAEPLVPVRLILPGSTVKLYRASGYLWSAWTLLLRTVAFSGILNSVSIFDDDFDACLRISTGFV